MRIATYGVRNGGLNYYGNIVNFHLTAEKPKPIVREISVDNHVGSR